MILQILCQLRHLFQRWKLLTESNVNNNQLNLPILHSKAATKAHRYHHQAKKQCRNLFHGRLDVTTNVISLRIGQPPSTRREPYLKELETRNNQCIY